MSLLVFPVYYSLCIGLSFPTCPSAFHPVCSVRSTGTDQGSGSAWLDSFIPSSFYHVKLHRFVIVSPSLPPPISPLYLLLCLHNYLSRVLSLFSTELLLWRDSSLRGRRIKGREGSSEREARWSGRGNACNHAIVFFIPPPN